jgi:Tfp pilus assembly PilM family ATPase/Tfp pilus assembly protein PilN
MPRLLALEWNDNEARVVVASLHGTQAVFEQALAVPLRTGEGSNDEPIPDVGSQIAAGLRGGLKGTDTLVAIGRTNIELRQVSVPAAPDDELPDLVRFQAMREFTALDDTWPLDFIPLSTDPEQSQQVLAATINPDQLSEIRKVCRDAGLRPQRMILRPCAGASLFSRRTPPGDGQVRLLVDLLQSEADLTLLIDGTVNLTRCARMPSDPLDQPEAPKALISELRRTIAAAHNQLGDRRVDELVLFGSGPRHEALAETVRTETSLPITLFDRFQGLQLGGRLAREMPDSPDRFAPLFGALLDELEQKRPAVDFLHPRRRPQPPSRRKSYVMAGLAVALVVISFVGWRWNTRRVLMNERAVLEQEMATAPLLSADLVEKYQVSPRTLLDQARMFGQVRVIGRKSKASRLADESDDDKKQPSLARLEEQAKKVDRAVVAIKKWNADKVNWLGELQKLSKTLSKDNSLGSEGILVTQFNAKRVQGTGGGEITLKGWAKNSDAIEEMERVLRNARYRVKAGDKSIDPSRGKYPQLFDHTLSMTGGDDDDNQ